MTQLTKDLPETSESKQIDECSVVLTSSGVVSRILRTCPVAFITSVSYLAVIFPMGFIFHNPELPFLTSLYGMAVGAAFVVEMVLWVWTRSYDHASPGKKNVVQFLQQKENKKYSARLYYDIGLATMLSGSLTAMIAATMGVGRIDVQIGEASVTSPIGNWLVMFRPYIYSGTVLLVWAFLQGACTKRRLFFWIGVAIGLRLVYVLQIGVTVQIWRYLLFLVFLLVYIGIIRIRTVIICLLIVLIAWPTFYSLRNQIREASGVRVLQSQSAVDRIRFDLQAGRAADFSPGQDIGQLTILDIPRYAVIPRVLDPDRPILGTARLINYYLFGGTDTSASSFLPVATTWVLYGSKGLILLYSGWAVLGWVIIHNGKQVTITRLVLFGFFLFNPMGWFTIYPESAVGFIQNCIAQVPLMLLVFSVQSINRKGKAKQGLEEQKTF